MHCRNFKRFLFTLFLVVTIISCIDEKKVIKQTEIFFKKEGKLTIFKPNSKQITFDIEIADNKFDIQTGLMYRNLMQINQGMLFVFEDNRERSFYMKNTRIPLDLVFINEDKKIVSFQKNCKPLDESSLKSNAPAKYVLEINAGLVDSWHIATTDSISYSTLP